MQRRMESTQDEKQRRPGTISKLEIRINRALLQLERESEAFRDAGVRMDSIATAVALEYTDFRYTTGWRQHCPGLASWLEGFSRRPSMVRSRPTT